MARRLARNAYASCQAYTWPRVRDQWLSNYRAVVGEPAATPLVAALGPQ
jgi:hypothetical protein